MGVCDQKQTTCCVTRTLLILFLSLGGSSGAWGVDKTEAAYAEELGGIRVQKCCERNELMIDNRCGHENETSSDLFRPRFASPEGRVYARTPEYRFVIGVPQCGASHQWYIYHYAGSQDRLVQLDDGRLRHYIVHREGETQDPDYFLEKTEDAEGERFYDYQLGSYCVDKTVMSSIGEAELAIVCAPKMPTSWNDTKFLMRNVVDPVCRGMAMACYLLVAVVYFVVPQLRDLVGNILTTIAVCLIVSQAAQLVSTFTEFTSHISFLVADVVMSMSLLAAFFWLNSLGYYIWRTFRSRNVFLRVSDGRKYCYYASYAWTCTLSMTAVALFAHFMLDINPRGVPTASGQRTLGWLGMALFFTPVAFTILVNIIFYLTTGHVINRMSTYGRIHHKMKFSFEMFIKLFLVMSITWMFMLLSWLRYDALVYCYIVINALQAPTILYITVLGQRRVTFLLRKSCCYEGCPCTCCRPGDVSEGTEWGEEMMTMNTAHY